MAKSRHSLRLVFAALTLTFLCLESVAGQFDADAPEPLTPPKGSIVLADGPVTEALRREFLGEFRNAPVALVLVAGPSARDVVSEISAFKALGVQDVTLLAIPDADAAKGAGDAFDGKNGAWILGADVKGMLAALRGTAVEAGLRSVLDRGGVIGAANALGCGFGIKTDDPNTEGLGLVPGTVIMAGKSKEEVIKELTVAVKSSPSLVGLGLPSGSAITLRQRYLRGVNAIESVAVVAGRGEAPATVRMIGSGRRQLADLLTLNRLALQRVHGVFPTSPTPTPFVDKGSLVIVGGGGMPDGLMERFIALAGGKDAPIVFVPCTPDLEVRQEPSFVAALRRAGATQVSWIHTKDRTKSDKDEAILEPLKRAKGIWFGGGRQWNLVDSYHDTEAHRLMHDVLARGGVIGGSSAGASIQGDYMARGDPLGNLNIMAPGYDEGLGFLCGVAIDQHFSQRNRLADMESLVTTYPQILGIGIDETTALIVQKSRAEIFGRGNVFFYDRRNAKDNEKVPPIVTRKGQIFDLDARRVGK